MPGVPVRLAGSLTKPAAALIVGGWFALSSVGATAQTRLETAEAAAGTDVDLSFVVGPGCGGGTAALRLDVPEGLLRVRPQAPDGWRMTVREGSLAYIYNFRDAMISSGVKSVEWTAEAPAAGEARFEIRASVAVLPVGEKLAFSAVQICGDGGRRSADPGGLVLTVAAPRGGRL